MSPMGKCRMGKCRYGYMSHGYMLPNPYWPSTNQYQPVPPYTDPVPWVRRHIPMRHIPIATFTHATFTHRRHLPIASIRYDAWSIRYLIVVAYGYLSRENWDLIEAMGKCRLWVNVALGPMRHLPMMGICRPWWVYVAMGICRMGICRLTPMHWSGLEKFKDDKVGWWSRRGIIQQRLPALRPLYYLSNCERCYQGPWHLCP